MACKKLNRSRHLICFMALVFFLMVPTLSPLQFMAQGKKLTPKLKVGATQWMESPNDEEKVAMMTMRRRIAIGSRPPKCSQRCKSCGHCEAVQVPIVSIKKTTSFMMSYEKFVPRFLHARGDDISNYKPMCWKCKCGDFFFNPW